MATICYLWDEQFDNITTEFDESNQPIAEYLNVPELYGSLISQHRDGNLNFYVFDAAGNTRKILDASGNISDSYVFTAFGVEKHRIGNTVNGFGFGGEYQYLALTEESDLYVRNRTYSPSVGRWNSRDPIGMIDGVNLYLYAGNQPVDFVDPSGFITIEAIKKGTNLKSSDQCGDKESRERSATWRFLLDYKKDEAVKGKRRKSPCLGFFVQEVNVKCNSTDCDSEEEEPYDYTYYETWTIPKNKRYPTQRDAKYTDKASYTPVDDSFGELQQKGVVKFFCQDHKKDPSKKQTKSFDPKKEGFVVGGFFGRENCRISAIDLLAHSFPDVEEGEDVKKIPFKERKYRVPDFFKQDSFESPAERSFKMTWNCCGGCDESITAEATPELDGE